LRKAVILAALALVLGVVAVYPVFADDESRVINYFDIPLAWADPGVTAPGPFLRVYLSPDHTPAPTLYLPLRFCVERVGGSVRYDSALDVAWVEHNGKLIAFMPGNSAFWLDPCFREMLGVEQIKIEQKFNNVETIVSTVLVIDGRFYVPVDDLWRTGLLQAPQAY